MSTSEVSFATAATDAHFEGILRLQKLYHSSALSPAEQAVEGFVFAEHTLPLLRTLAAELPQAIALVDGRVVGYCLAMPPSLHAAVPSLRPMFEQFRRCAYRGRPLDSWRYFVGGQVCVDRAHRGRGLLARLYRHLQSSVSGYALCVTEIAARNHVSLRAHEKLGFEPVSTYSDGVEAWQIVAWRLRGSEP